ncbi:MAG: ferritin-like domain-containing protein [Bacteroides sp.]|nr:ferritin-like domain-containing protein [Bacteroides sp.]
MFGKNGEMKGKEFKEFFIDNLKDIYWAEKELTKALPEMQEAATSPQAAAAFEKHTRETERHVQLVEQVFQALGVDPETKKCPAMEGLVKEAKEIIKDTDKDSFIRDAGLILAAQKVEHYEIATYGTLRIFSRYLGDQEVTALLEQILSNEKETDVSLTVIAEDFINAKAAEE